MSVCTRERVILGLVVLVLLSTIIGIVAYFVPKTNNHEDTISELREQIGRRTVPSTTKGVDRKGTTQIIQTAPPVATTTTSKVPKKAFDTRIDCIPESKGKFVKATRELCNERGCIYDKTGVKDVPVCYHGDDRGYRVVGHSETRLGFRMVLESKGRGPFGNDIKKAVFDVEMWDENIVRFKFDDPEFSRYKVPLQINIPARKSSATAYEVKIINRKTFAFQIIRKSTGKVLWDTSVGGLVLSDQFLQISTKLPSQHIYGFGENLHQRLHHDLNWRTWPMFALSGNVHNTPTGNHYGVHPFYTCMEDDGNSHGVFLLNSNAMDYSFTPLPMLTYRTIGGVLDFYMFLGPTPEHVVQQYTGIVGRSYMPPYWALGFQLSRYGYKNTAHMKTAVDRTKKYGIPLDVQYIDIDYKEQYLEFTLDTQRFSGIAEYFTSLRNEGMRTVVILDPPLVSNMSGYEPYDRLSQAGGAVKWPEDYNAVTGDTDSTNAMLGYNRPVGKVVYPDFLNNRTGAVWADLIVKHNSRIPFDGIWIDMNEPENYGTNEARPRTWPEGATPYWTLDCPTNNRYEEPPYRTMAGFVHDTHEQASRLSDGTLCMVGRQGDHGEYRHYDVHSLYGWSQAPPTLKGVQRTTGGRGFVLSRSTYPGSGKYASHWLGDGKSLWPDMIQSIIGMLEFNLFGIPHVGADICGYEGNPTPELCKRWIQLGAFYPYSRSHSRKVDLDQDPGYFGDDVATAAREAIETRYWLLPYLYTLFHKAHVTGDTVARPVFHEFPNASFAYEVDAQFMWGPHLMIVPILQENAYHVLFYKPDALWYDLYTGSSNGDTDLGKVNVNSSSKIPLFVRGGAILPMQQPANNTHFSRRNPLKLMVALRHNSTAEGELFWDDGESKDTYESGNYFYAKFKADKFSVSMEIEHGSFDVSSLYFDGITLYGAPPGIKSVSCNLTRVSFNYEINNDSDNLKSILIISNVSIPLDKDFAVRFRYDDSDETTHFINP